MFRALTKIRLRQMPDVASPPTGAVLEAGEVFHVDDVVPPPAANELGYFRVHGRPGWVFDKGISGSWAGRRIVERLGDAEAPKSSAELQREAEKVEEEANRVDAAIGPSEISIAKLLAWARAQRSVKIHPGVSARGSKLVVSMPVDEGTPLLGILPETLLAASLGPGSESRDADKEYQQLLEATTGADKDILGLALRLLRERGDATSPWDNYLGCLPSRPAAPITWNTEQVTELQYTPIRQAIKDQAEWLSDFVDSHFKASRLGRSQGDPLAALSWAFASASERSVAVVGRGRVLVPVLDLVGPPEGVAQTVGADDMLAPSCRLAIEGDGDDAILVLYAARRLESGDVLTRDVGCSNAEELLLRCGVAGEEGGPGDCVVDVAGCIGEGTAERWQLRAINRAMRTKPGRLGDVSFQGQVRRHSELSEALSGTFFHVARVISCESQEELDVVVGDNSEEVSPVSGLQTDGVSGIYGRQRDRCINALERTLKACRGDFATTLAEDKKALPSLEGIRRTAVAYRLGKKRALDEVLRQVEDARQKPGGGLPFAVTGLRP